MKIKFFRHTADVEYEAQGKTIEEAFENAAIALQEVMVNTKKVELKTTKEISIQSEDMKSLLYDFLEKFLIFHDAEDLVFGKVKVIKIWKTTGVWKLEARAMGEKFDENKHEPRTAIKAVTYFNMDIGKKDSNFFVHVVLDI
ncbi:MAG: archease [Candidatus Parvarchaeota archaeon]|nr:archease [Candidatus Jingweiarchaeum tengchongense]MCW1297814.1 archease [Candidatus Jingweiarchaeum tengchongense]MCW1299824.1 archease [Candidatus Jingweiarchaeum tengchongense]MCW1304205.1 archease [Candidatus Jingweiarchaeum tengchongense]MCW1305233.1 archease [Candidatus Jingweiarchaeum tengchongense]